MLLVMTIGGIIVLSILCRKRRRRSDSRKAIRTVTSACISARNINAKTPEQQRRDAERSRKEQFKRYQAQADIIHYTQVKTDLLKAFDASGALSGDSEKAIRKRIQYDNAIRKTEKQIEKAMFDARRTG